MAYKEKEIEKLYFSIGEVSELLQINASQIRYWEGEFSVLKPRKDRKGNRLFVKEDIETIKLIQYLVKDKGYTLEGAKAKLKGGLDDVQQNFKVIESLQKVKGFLEQLKEEL
jgi:DNA-binding transcriptional MerR regulator